MLNVPIPDTYFFSHKSITNMNVDVTVLLQKQVASFDIAYVFLNTPRVCITPTILDNPSFCCYQ